MIAPAIAELREEGIESIGPLAADTHVPRRAPAPRYDAALCMYHDQALIPLKTLHFDEGVNITLGPADRAHLARPRHRLRDRRTGPRRARRDDRRDPDGRAVRAERRARAACATLDRPAPAPRGDRAARPVGASKALGQNFLLDAQSARAASPAFRATCRRRECYEVGPGPGGLTRALLRAGAEGDRGRARPALPARPCRARRRPSPAGCA